MSSEDYSRLRYLNVFTPSNTWSHNLNYVLDALRVAAVARRWPFQSAPLLHIAVPRCPAASASRGVKISHLSHRGWGVVTSLRMAMVSSTFRCTKYIHRLGRSVDLPGNPSTRHSIDGYIQGKATQYSTKGAVIRNSVVAATACTSCP